jgi:hypothetical protein
MPGAKKNFIGLEGFIWWIGVVEDRQDPEQLGRVRVRCFGWHTEEKDKIPTDQLPWAHPVIPVNNPNTYTPKEGDMVFGFFIDGNSAQNPAIMGVLPGKPEKKPDYQKGFSDPGINLSKRPNKPNDSSEQYPKSKYIKEQTTNRLSRGKTDATVIATRKKNLKKNITSVGGVTWNEPNPAFNPTYPYNNALETESGHALEFDDSPGQERVHLAHRKGSFIEIDKDGNRVEKVVKDNYTLVMGSDYVFVSGKCSVTVDGDCNLKVGGNLNIGAGGDVRIKGKKVFIESTSTTDFKIGGEAKITSGGKLNLKGSTAALQGAVIDLPAAQINMQSGSAASASGTGLTGGGQAPTETEVAAANEATQESANIVAATSAANAVAPVTSTTISSTSAEGIAGIGSATGSTVGKVVGGLTSTVDNSFAKISGAADGVLKDFASQTPIGELSAKVSAFEGLTNENKGSILSLRTDLQNTLKNKIGEIATKSAENNIEFNVDSDLLPPSAAKTVTRVIGKHVYPSTETIEKEGNG